MVDTRSVTELADDVHAAVEHFSRACGCTRVDRCQPAGESIVRIDDVEVDLAAKGVLRAGTRVHLTPTEWRMLEFLARNPGSLVTRQTLLKEI